MNALKLIPVALLLLTSSCVTVRVATDYDKSVNFEQYTSYAFYKPGIDKAKISDLDKKRILRAIETELNAKGLTKSQTPQLLVSIFTKERERVDVYQRDFGYGWGWHPWWYGRYYDNTVSSTTEGSLYIDILDAKNNELIWQGLGTTQLVTDNMEKKEERIREIVREILKEYPPGVDKN